MNRICGWKRGVATGVEIFANDSGTSASPKNMPNLTLWGYIFPPRVGGECLMREKSKLPKKSGGLDKKSKKERPPQTTIFRYERGNETVSPPRSKSGK